MPRRSAFSRPFWEACNQGRLLLQRCQAVGCGKYVFYPRVCCPHCGGGDLRWEDASGRGRIVSFTRVHRPHHESFYADAPICFIAVRLEEGPLIYSRLSDKAASDEGLIGSEVRTVFVEHAVGEKLPFFALTTPKP